MNLFTEAFLFLLEQTRILASKMESPEKRSKRCDFIFLLDLYKSYFLVQKVDWSFDDINGHGIPDEVHLL